MATIEKRGNRYKIIVSLGYDLSGRQIRKRMTWTPEPDMTPKQIQKELNRQSVLFEERCLRGEVLDDNMKFATFIELWMKDHAEKQLKATTIAFYRHMLKRVLPAMGHLQISKIKPHHLLEFYDNLAEAGVRDDEKFQCKIKFKELLKKRKLTKVKLAEMAGVSITVLNSITQGKSIRKVSAQKVSAALDLRVDEIFQCVNADDSLASKTILHHHRMLSSILNTAVQWQAITNNPCTRIRAPRVEKNEPRYLDEVETAMLLECLDGEKMQYQVMIKLFIYTGFRRGELAGLEWPDIDFEHSVIHIRRESLYLPEKGIFEEDGKSGAAIRSIKVSEYAMTMLKAYKAWQAEERLKLGDRWQNHDRLFTRWDGKPIHPGVITAWFLNFVKRNGLPNVSIHSLRHTNATLMIAGGTAVTTVANRLGHADASTTTRIYAHAIRSADEAAAETLQDILNPRKKA